MFISKIIKIYTRWISLKDKHPISQNMLTFLEIFVLYFNGSFVYIKLDQIRA